MRAEITATLSEQLLMRDYLRHFFALAAERQYRWANRQQDFANYDKRRVDQKVESQVDRAFGRVLDRHDAEIRAPVLDCLEDRGERLQRHLLDARAKAHPRRVVRVGMLGAEERDARFMLERAAGRNNLDVDPFDLIVGKRALVFGDHLFDNRALTHRLINLAALMMLEPADFCRDASAGRDEAQDFEINLVHPRAQSLDRRRF